MFHSSGSDANPVSIRLLACLSTAVVLVLFCLVSGCGPGDEAAQVTGTPVVNQDSNDSGQEGSLAVDPSPGETESSEIQSQPAPFAANNDTVVELVDEKDWLFFRGDSMSTGVATTVLPETPEVLWEYEVEQGAFFGAATIVDTGTPTVFIADADGTVYALALNDGSEIWKKKHGFSYGTTPVYRDGRLYVGDIDGKFVCLDAADGEEIWNFEAAAEINSSANFHKDNVIFGSQDFRLYALDAKTGEKAWEVETADQVRCSLTVVGDVAFVAGCDGHLHVIDLNEGMETGSVDIGAPTGATPAVLGDFVYGGTEGSGFFCVNWSDAEEEWGFEPQPGMAIRSSAALTGEHAVFAAGNRVIYSLDPDSGDINWETAVQSKIESSAVIVGDRVFMGGMDGRFYSIDLEDGQVLEETEYNGGFVGSPAVAYGRMVIATDRGVIYCLGKHRSPE